MTKLNTWALGLLAWFAVAVPAYAQDAAKDTTSEALPGYLNLVTLGLVLLVAVGAFMFFLRKRSNREATERGLGMDDTNTSSRSDRRI